MGARQSGKTFAVAPPSLSGEGMGVGLLPLLPRASLDGLCLLLEALAEGLASLNLVELGILDEVAQTGTGSEAAVHGLDVGLGEDRLLAGVLVNLALTHADAAQRDVEGTEGTEVDNPAVEDEVTDAVHKVLKNAGNDTAAVR